VNLREGTRRLALLLGVVGAILGGFASYLELQTVLNQRARHNKFEQLAASDVVKHERKCRLAGILSGCSDLPADFIVKDSKTGVVLDWSKARPITPEADWKIWEVGEPSTVNKGGIKNINWSADYGIESILTEDGQTLYPTPAPAAWEYLLIALFPILGFFIPWGAVRAIGWVGAGFVQSAK
jgi:hypothetical protein